MTESVLLCFRDVPDIQFWLAGYPAIFKYPVPAKMAPSTGYLNQIVIRPFWKLVLPWNQLPGVITVQ